MSFDFSVVQNQDMPVRNQANPTIIKVIGCGGGGSSAVSRMISANVQDVEFIVLNTDLQALNKSPAPTKLPIGQKLTGGLGAGGNPEVGENAAREDSASIEEIVSGADMVIVTAGMGGGTGTGSVPIVAEIARKAGALTIAVVTTPFEFEGSGRMRNAEEGLKKLRESVDSLIVIPNEQVFKVIEKKVNFRQAFQIADELLCQGVQGISEIITKPGDVNLDFNDVKSVMKDQGDTLLGVGEGEGENRGIDAAQMAISNPMLENLKMDGASKILINITGSDDLGMTEVQEIVKTITASANKNNEIFWGQVMDPEMEGKVRVTVIATGFAAKSEPVAEVADTPKVNRDENVVTSRDLDDILHGGMTSFASKSEEPAVTPVSGETEEKRTLGGDLFGSFESVNTSFKGSQLTPPGNVNHNDINQPACWRNNSDYGRSINLSDD